MFGLEARSAWQRERSTCARTRRKGRRHGAEDTAPKTRRRRHGAEDTAPKTRRRRHGAEDTAPKTRRRRHGCGSLHGVISSHGTSARLTRSTTSGRVIFPGVGMRKGQPPDARARADQRRRLWSGGVMTPAQHGALEARFWNGASGEQLLAAVWEMATEQWYREHPDGPPPRLDRSVGGVRRHRG
jgi:hypothetical protein